MSRIERALTVIVGALIVGWLIGLAFGTLMESLAERGSVLKRPCEPQSSRSSVALTQPKPRKPGRPKLPKGDAKSSIVPIRLNAEDRKRIEAAARASNQSVSEWIRRTLSAAIGG